ncbi:MAG: helix-turn-helix domain-containing protein [Planctomycetaceae bacterium]|nr:helix-turn-helix domain-containing protein [Planctomycetaceae bacterium]
MLKDALTVQQIAEAKQVDIETVKYWIVSKQLAATNVCRTPGGKKPRWRILPEDFDAFLATRGNRPAAAQQAQAAKPRRKQIATSKEWV